MNNEIVVESNEAPNLEVVHQIRSGIGVVPGLASLFKKISQVTGDIGAVPRDKSHQQGYKYQSWEAVADHVSAALGKYNLSVTMMDDIDRPTEVIEKGKTSNGAPTYRYIKYYLVLLGDGDTGAYMVVPWSAMTDDFSDKAFAKASTFAEKDFLRKTFVISDRDTEDADAGNVSAEVVYENAPPAPKKPNKTTTQKPPPASQQPPANTPPAAAPPKDNVTQFTNPRDQKQTVSSAPLKNREVFLSLANTMGYDGGGLMAVLDQFKFPKDPETKRVKYSEAQHDNMLAALGSWKKAFDVLFAVADPDDQERMTINNSVSEVMDTLVEAGAPNGSIPIEHNLENRAKLYIDFIVNAVQIDENFREILKESGFDNLDVTNYDLMISTLKEKVAARDELQAMVDEEAGNVVEDGGEIDDIMAAIGAESAF